MTPRMQQVLVELSSFYDPSPTEVFRCILSAIVEIYPDTMAMVNLIEGDAMRYREVANPRPGVKEGGLLALSRTY